MIGHVDVAQPGEILRLYSHARGGSENRQFVEEKQLRRTDLGANNYSHQLRSAAEVGLVLSVRGYDIHEEIVCGLLGTDLEAEVLAANGLQSLLGEGRQPYVGFAPEVEEARQSIDRCQPQTGAVPYQCVSEKS